MFFSRKAAHHFRLCATVFSKHIDVFWRKPFHLQKCFLPQASICTHNLMTIRGSFITNDWLREFKSRFVKCIFLWQNSTVFVSLRFKRKTYRRPCPRELFLVLLYLGIFCNMMCLDFFNSPIFCNAFHHVCCLIVRRTSHIHLIHRNIIFPLFKFCLSSIFLINFGLYSADFDFVYITKVCEKLEDAKNHHTLRARKVLTCLFSLSTFDQFPKFLYIFMLIYWLLRKFLP